MCAFRRRQRGDPRGIIPAWLRCSGFLASRADAPDGATARRPLLREGLFYAPDPPFDDVCPGRREGAAPAPIRSRHPDREGGTTTMTEVPDAEIPAYRYTAAM